MQSCRDPGDKKMCRQGPFVKAGGVTKLVTKFNRPTLLRNPPSKNHFGSNRVDKLPPEVTRKAAMALLVG